MVHTARLPVELWEEILPYALLGDLLPRRGASLMEDMDVFAHPCKIYTRAMENRTTLRLVCRLWDHIVQSSPRSRSYFAQTIANEAINVRNVVRLELVNGKGYRRGWPCPITSQRGGRCPPRSLMISYYVLVHDEKLGFIEHSTDVKVIRFLDDVRNPCQLLESCPSLQALWIRFSSILAFSTLENPITRHLTHLHMTRVQDCGQVYVLSLPQVVYLSLELNLGFYLRASRVFPLNIHAPRVLTLIIGGNVKDGYISSVENLILSTGSSLVNLLLSHTQGGDFSTLFSHEPLIHFPHLSTLGLSIQNFHLLLAHPAFLKSPPVESSTSPSLTLLLLGLDDPEHRNDSPGDRKIWAKQCVQTINTSGKWFSSIVVPFDWPELEQLWVDSCKLFDSDDEEFDDGDPLPCPWSFLDYLNGKGVLIRDRTGTSLRDYGASFSNAMKVFQEDKEWMEKRRKVKDVFRCSFDLYD